MKWYMIITKVKLELKAKESLEKVIKTAKKESSFGRIIVPSVEEDVIVRGKKQKKTSSLYPGYMLVEMDLSNESAFVLKSANHVIGFLGGAKPDPISDVEFNKIMEKVTAKDTRVANRPSFSQGEEVTILDGPFKDFKGTVDTVKDDKMKVVVLVTVFGRATPVELDYEKVIKGA